MEKSILSREQARQLIRENNLKTGKDVHNLLKNMFKDVLQEILEAELDEELGYTKYDYKNKTTANSRNGHSKKEVISTMGEMELKVPRDRKSEFNPIAVPKREKDISSLEDHIMSMYAKGVSDRDIKNHMDEIYGLEVSADMVSRITDKILPIVKEWQNRPLQAIYTMLYFDAMFFNVRQDGQIIKKSAYVIIGYDIEGNKDILGIWIAEHESAKFWLSILNDLKNRGVKDILIASIDGLTGLADAIRAAFPNTEIQRCIVHQIRNSCKFVSYKDRKEFVSDMKSIYTANTKDSGFSALEDFDKKWGNKYPYAVKSWYKNWEDLSTFFKYPPDIRRLIYTTNPIESFNSMVKRRLKSKGSFPSDDALLKLLYLAAYDISKKWTQKIRNWDSILSQFLILFDDRVSPYV